MEITTSGIADTLLIGHCDCCGYPHLLTTIELDPGTAAVCYVCIQQAEETTRQYDTAAFSSWKEIPRELWRLFEEPLTIAFAAKLTVATLLSLAAAFLATNTWIAWHSQ